MDVFSYTAVTEPKELSSKVWHNPPEIPCIYTHTQTHLVTLCHTVTDNQIETSYLWKLVSGSLSVRLVLIQHDLKF